MDTLTTTTLMSDPETAAGIGLLAGGIAGFIASFGILLIAFYVLLIIAWWKIFVKAGEKGWKSLIPFYNVYILFKIFWDTKTFWTFICIYLGCSIIASILTNFNIAVIPGIINLGAAIYALVIDILLSIRESKSFGHGGGFAVGLIFLPNIFALILGFNKDKYKKIAK